MAQEFYGFFDSTVSDAREYDAAGFANILQAALQNGVTSHFGGGLLLSADGSGMTATLSPGGVVIGGYLYVLSDDGGAAKTFEFSSAAASDRVDRVVARLNLAGDVRSITLAVKEGTPGADPQPPALTRVGQVYELSLARVLVRAAALSIAANDVTDEREDESVCGLATSKWLSYVQLDERYRLSPLAEADIDAVLATP